MTLLLAEELSIIRQISNVIAAAVSMIGLEVRGQPIPAITQESRFKANLITVENLLFVSGK